MGNLEGVICLRDSRYSRGLDEWRQKLKLAIGMHPEAKKAIAELHEWQGHFSTNLIEVALLV